MAQRAARVLACLLAAGCGLALAGSPAANASTLPSGFRDSVVFSNLEEPTAVRFSPDGRVFVAEKPGRILVFDSLTDPAPTVFADFRTDVFDSEDRGLLGLVLAPDFPDDPHVYALYTYDHILGDPDPPPQWGEPDHTGDQCPHPEGACEVSGRLVRLTAAGGGDVAVGDGSGHPLQDVLIEDWCQQFSSHSIGDLEFDSSGALYASGGDGASFNSTDYGQFGFPDKNPCADPPVGFGGIQTLPGAEGGALRSQDLRTPGDPTGLDGTVIRVDPDTGEGLPGNPLFGSSDPNVRRIVAYGFRNPFRFAIDPASEEIYVGNVGWVTTEEIDRFPAVPAQVYNSGWPCYEGLGPNDAYQGGGVSLCQDMYAEPGSASEPFFHYQHANTIIPDDACPSEDGWAVSGLDVYDGSTFPAEYHGALFFADAVRGCIYVMKPGGDGRPDPLTTTTFMSDAGSYSGVNVETGPDGDLYYVKLFGDPEKGSIHKISYDPGAPTARLSATPEWGGVPLQVELDASGSTDPDGEALEYDWDLDGNGSFEVLDGGPTQSRTYSNGSTNRTISVRVTDGHGESSVAQVVVYPGDTPPQPQIDEPGEDLEWGVGQEVDFAGSADDTEDGGTLPDDDLYWKTHLYHCPAGCHAHPLQVFPGVSEGSFIAPDHDYPSHIEIVLTATDSRGLSATRSVSIEARPFQIQIGSNPPGLQLEAGLVSNVAPFTFTAVDGAGVVLSAPATQKLGGTTYAWTAWSDGGERVHTVEAGAAPAYTATYEPVADPPVDEPPPSGDGFGAGADQGAVTPPPLAAVKTTLGRHPGKRTLQRSASFTFSASVAGARFLCKLDRRQFQSCRSPQVYRHLRLGRHTFEVAALDALGAPDPFPQTFEWRVLCPLRRGAQDSGSRRVCSR